MGQETENLGYDLVPSSYGICICNFNNRCDNKTEKCISRFLAHGSAFAT